MNTYIKRPVAPIIRAQAATILIAIGVLTAPIVNAQTQLQTGQPAANTTAAANAPEPALPYTVKRSDKLIVLTADLLNKPSDWPEVARFNRLKNPNQISPGQVINIPTRLMKSQPASSTVISTFGDVRVGGLPLVTGAAVGEGAKVQTAANSSAVIELADGSRMTLLPGTLAEIVTSRSYATRDAGQSASTTAFSGLLRLMQGALDMLASKNARRATPLQIETPTSLVGVRGTQFRVAYDSAVSQNARTEVLQGLVRADNPAQRAGTDVPQGKGVILSPAVKDIVVADLLKAPDLSAVPSDIVKPEALWPMPILTGAAAYRVQIAVDDSFNKIVRDLVVTGAKDAFANLADLPNGGWFARVRGIDAAGIEGYDTAKAVQVVLPPPPYVAPKQWTISGDRLDVTAGGHILRFNQQGLDASHIITAEVTANTTLPASLATATASGDKANIIMDLGYLPPGTELRLNLTVVQSDGAKVIPLAYRFMPLAGWGWADGMLQSVTPQGTK